MAYIAGIVSREELEELRRRGWEDEDCPRELLGEINPPGTVRRMFWVDSSVFEVMDGPDWEKGHVGKAKRGKQQ